MSDVPPWIRSGLTAALNAIRVLSGDHEKDDTENALPFVRSVPAAGAVSAAATSIVRRCWWVYSRRTTSKSPT